MRQTHTQEKPIKLQKDALCGNRAWIENRAAAVAAAVTHEWNVWCTCSICMFLLVLHRNTLAKWREKKRCFFVSLCVSFIHSHQHLWRLPLSFSSEILSSLFVLLLLTHPFSIRPTFHCVCMRALIFSFCTLEQRPISNPEREN